MAAIQNHMSSCEIIWGLSLFHIASAAIWRRLIAVADAEIQFSHKGITLQIQYEELRLSPPLSSL